MIAPSLAEVAASSVCDGMNLYTTLYTTVMG